MDVDFLEEYEFFSGVPDSLLKPLCDYLIDRFGIGEKHIIAADEGNAIAMAAGYFLATGKVPVVYMQNSGLGNAINPLASLMHKEVYGIPCILIIGWRGEPGVHDELQHVFQGECTIPLLETMDIPYCIIDKTSNIYTIEEQKKEWSTLLKQGRQVAFVVKKGSLEYSRREEVDEEKEGGLFREEAIRIILEASGRDKIFSTTGKASRELFELREERKEGHGNDFLTVGSMGHSSSIALEYALQKPEERIWCIDGDGACLMHMGAMALIGTSRAQNLIHIVINNGAHESVGGMPTVGKQISFLKIAEACGYKEVYSVDGKENLKTCLEESNNIQNGPVFIEVICRKGSRENLGRPTLTAEENKNNFMKRR